MMSSGFMNIPQSKNVELIAVGGGGINATRYIMECQSNTRWGFSFVDKNFRGVDTTDVKTVLLEENFAKAITRNGRSINTNHYHEAALDARSMISELVNAETDLVVIVVGMGEATGTGAAPVVASIIKETGTLTVAVVSKPYPFQGNKSCAVAEMGIAEIRPHVDKLCVLSGANDGVPVVTANLTLSSAMKAMDKAMYKAVLEVVNESEKTTLTPM